MNYYEFSTVFVRQYFEEIRRASVKFCCEEMIDEINDKEMEMHSYCHYFLCSGQHNLYREVSKTDLRIVMSKLIKTTGAVLVEIEKKAELFEKIKEAYIKGAYDKYE